MNNRTKNYLERKLSALDLTLWDEFPDPENVEEALKQDSSTGWLVISVTKMFGVTTK